MGYNPLTPITQAYKAGDYDHAQMQAKGLGYAWFEGSQSERDGDFWLDNSANATAAMILALVDICLKDDKLLNEALIQESYQHGKSFQPSTINEDKISMYSCVKTFTELADVEGALDIFSSQNVPRAIRQKCAIPPLKLLPLPGKPGALFYPLCFPS